MLRDEIFTESGAIGPSVETGDASSAALSESAKVAVLNGAGEEGLATQFSERVKALGLDVVEIGNADRMDYPTTRIIDYTGNPYTTHYLLESMGLTQGQILSQINTESEVDIAVIVGYDWQNIISLLPGG
jgi:hypothetical protein